MKASKKKKGTNEGVRLTLLGGEQSVVLEREKKSGGGGVVSLTGGYRGDIKLSIVGLLPCHN